MFKGRVALAVGMIAAAFALVLGFSSTTASASVLGRTKVVIVGTAPAQPVAGATFTITFQLTRAGVPIHIAGIGCHAQIGNNTHAVPIVESGTDGTVAHCTWAVPLSARGKTFDGFVAATSDRNVTYFRGFDLPVS